MISKFHYSIILIYLFCFCSFIKASNKTDKVNLFIGTAGDNGQVSPAACVPYGMVQVCPDMTPRSHSGYDYDVNTISGFTINRLSGIGCSGAGGNIRIKPSATNINLEIKKDTEKATPGYYSVTLDNGVKAELTATKNIAVERFVYPKGEDKVMTLDLTAGFEKVRECQYEIISSNEIVGFIRTGNTCNHGEYKLYFSFTTNRKFEIVSKSDSGCELKFTGGSNSPIEVRIAVSPIDKETARMENQQSAQVSFTSIRKQAEVKWNNILSRVDIKGASKDEQTLFYTSLYRIFLSPSNVTSFDNRYLATDGQIRSATDFTYYSSWSMWDSYRTKFPLITLIDPETTKDIALSLTKLFVYGKKDWATSFESTPTVRTEHSMSVLLDIYNKGITFDLSEAYVGFKKEIESLQTNRPDQAFETSIDLWSMSRIASILDKKEDADMYENKARDLFTSAWNQTFKDIDSSFTQMRNSGLYQGTRWQYRWAVPRYLDIMAETSGGKNALLGELTYYYDNHLSNQTNEPGLHNPYLFNRLGQPGLAQIVVRKILTEKMIHLYGGNAEYHKPVFDYTFKVDTKGYLPEMDEDDGTMSAYYIFGTIGLYPLIVGEPWYEITSPLYDDIILTLENKKKLMIKAIGRQSKGDLIKKVSFNGTVITDFRINHNDLVKGETLLFEY